VTVVQKEVCKSICEHLNDGVCMGLCSTDHEYVQRCYDEKKKDALAKGLEWENIPVFEIHNDEKPSLEATLEEDTVSSKVAPSAYRMHR
tara:strand:+ start:2679 stop:2945 length:267 start_codon:yes stop_codon:yes gene_type:complete